MNVALLIGRMVADPELKYLTDGKPVCSFRIAVDRPRKNAAGEKEASCLRTSSAGTSCIPPARGSLPALRTCRA